IIEKAKKIELLLMDVDGVLTDGKMYFIPQPMGKTQEFKSFNAVDGIGIRMLALFNISSGIITGRESEDAQERAELLAMKYAYQGFLSKTKPLEEILKDAGVKPENTAYIGDDLTDIPVLKKVGLACAPKNAIKEVRDVAHLITEKNGGEGAVREVCDLILKSHGYWDKVMEYVDSAHWSSIEKSKIKIVKYSEYSRINS
ncbi:MAG: HAD hydrolase family protein, partial [Elusimicrobia bacterium]|nr:HAD hydrolase family protein [Elusimicrobiota bacterium]